MKTFEESERIKHKKALEEFSREQYLLIRGPIEGLISKSQAKKGLADLNNRARRYIEENNITIFGNYIYQKEEGDV
jgi:uncharacterized protein YciI